MILTGRRQMGPAGAPVIGGEFKEISRRLSLGLGPSGLNLTGLVGFCPRKEVSLLGEREDCLAGDLWLLTGVEGAAAALA